MEPIQSLFPGYDAELKMKSVSNYNKHYTFEPHIQYYWYISHIHCQRFKRFDHTVFNKKLHGVSISTETTDASGKCGNIAPRRSESIIYLHEE